ncbi:hypothetical protein RRG08_034236 [Elysia crispata]|uniref:Uncharacterized protein n=1 Tax=Elysia crispata TaxID=231223 RepID=A0AAE1A0U5_9GAST|nr:hypothetical protein RRG08_034236 [Elysia crispata]
MKILCYRALQTTVPCLTEKRRTVRDKLGLTRTGLALGLARVQVKATSSGWPRSSLDDKNKPLTQVTQFMTSNTGYSVYVGVDARVCGGCMGYMLDRLVFPMLYYLDCTVI